MGLAGGNVLPVQVAVEIDRGVDVLHDRVGLVAEPPAPHFVAHDPSAEVLSLMSEQSAEPVNNPARQNGGQVGWLRLISAVASIVVVAVLAGVYGIERLRGNPGDATCQAAVQTAAR